MTDSPFPARTRISLCMIVRNEAKTLARALASARPWVGEIVVVDTGSTDETVSIAESFGAKVGHFAWCDDFAKARNAALDLATSDWVLILDADETFEVTDPLELARAVEQDVLDGFSFRCLNRMDDGGVNVGMVFRLFRRTRAGMRYRGALHEQVAAVADREATTAALGCAHITHDGYVTTTFEAKGKVARNAALARHLVVERPDDAHAWYALGLSLHQVDEAEMLSAYDRALALLDAAGRDFSHEIYAIQLMHNLITGHHARGHAARARSLADRAAALFPHSPDVRFCRGKLRVDDGDFAGAAADFEVCLSPEAARCPVIFEPRHIGYEAQTGLAIAWLNLGRNVEAEALLVRAAETAPVGYTEPRRLLGSLLLQRGAWAEARPFLAAVLAMTPNDEQVRFNLGWCLYKLERYDEAEPVLAPLQARPDVQHLLGKVLLDAGQGARALGILTACPLPAAGLARGWAHLVTGEPQAAAACWDDWLRAGAADWGTKDTLAMFLFLMQGGRAPSGQPERPAEPLRDMDQWLRLLLRHGRFDEVEQVIQRGPQLGVRLWRPLRKRWGITLAKEGFFDVGLHLLLEARTDEAEDAEVYYWLGYCSLNKQHLEEARTLWETCLHYAPDHSLAAQGLSLLRR